jgi:hypothetical protein
MYLSAVNSFPLFSWTISSLLFEVRGAQKKFQSFSKAEHFKTEQLSKT